MSRRLGTLSAGAAIIGAVAMLTAGTAVAVTNYHTGTVAFTCNFPSIGSQQLDVTAQFNGPDSVPSGGTATPTDLSGTATISTQIHALLNAANYDGVRGKANVPVVATNATPVNSTVTNVNVPEQIFPYVPGPLTIQIVQDAGTGIPTLTAGSPGVASLSLNTTLSAQLEFHKKSGTWSAWTFNCSVKAGQNRAFSPNMPIT
ncbi:DUF6801 domain-containing protein [Amycolatopsis sp. cg5]|uniref:DUF6801 domain-containing protein n=1 Tax=Amycolatopsis sp. cg5 TaxID=3238802 RepID=UPI0035252E1F